MINFSTEELEQALSQCESEPIHQIGQIQPHGALLVLSPDSRRTVLQASNNLGEFSDLHVAVVCGNSLAEVIGVTQAEQIEQLIQQARDNNPAAKVVSLAHQRVVHNLQARVFLSGNMFVLELMRDLGVGQGQHFDVLLQQLQRSLLTVNAEKDIHRYFGRIAKVVRELTEFDRVMVYRFDNHWEGEVIAESKMEAAHSYLGTRFPASDIPPQARQLYTSNLVRQIADVGARGVPVLPVLNPATQLPLDMTHSVLRSLSPVHVEYLHNMGVRASMSISLLQNGRLWGLIACHHMTPKQVPYPFQEAAAFVSDIVSTRLSLTEINEQRNLGTEATRIIGDLLKSIITSTGGDLQLTLLPNLQVLLGATGIVMTVEGKHHVHGAVPQSDELSGLFAWLCTQPATDVFGCDSLTKEFAPAGSYPDIASGILVAPLSSDMRNCVLWLRKERIRTVQWAGRPEKVLSKDRAGVRLSPRKSFENWTETWRGRCEPWSCSETETARSIAQVLTQGLSQKTKLELEQQKTKQAEQAMRLKEMHLEEAQRIAKVGSWDLNLLTGKLTWSNEVFRMFEIDNSQFGATYEAFLNVIHPDDRDSVNHAYTNSLLTHSPYEITHRLRMSDGGIKWVRERCESDFDKEGKPLRSVGTVQDITEWKQAEDEKRLALEEKRLTEQRAHQQLAELSAHLVTSVEQERHKISREIHDDLGGNLTAIKIGLASLARQLDPNQPALIEKTRQLESIVDHTFEFAHRIAGDLRPYILDLGIVAALEWQAQQFEEHMGILCSFTANAEDLALPPEKSIVLFRVCQEALSNIAKHAKASLVTINLTASARHIKLRITDDGVGIAAGAQRKKNAFGLRGMAERVSALKGSLSIRPGAENGTEILVKLPR
jgi:light-regulated signal transduction histidine kinase (bacteriophytochrome)/signal transduction histidine kinase